jgi:hypothetical protein
MEFGRISGLHKRMCSTAPLPAEMVARYLEVGRGLSITRFLEENYYGFSLHALRPRLLHGFAEAGIDPEEAAAPEEVPEIIPVDYASMPRCGRCTIILQPNEETLCDVCKHANGRVSYDDMPGYTSPMGGSRAVINYYRGVR